MSDLFIKLSTEETENGFIVRMCCNPSHPIYKAHFPGNPITPGACLLQTAGTILQQKLQRPLYLKTAKNIKYLNVLVPEEGKVVKFDYSHLTETETGCKIQVLIADETTAYSKMSLSFSYEPL